MDVRRFLPILLLVVLSAATGALLADGCRSPERPANDEVARRQATRIEALTEEVRTLRSQARPTLAGSPPRASDPVPAPAPRGMKTTPKPAAPAASEPSVVGPGAFPVRALDRPGGMLDLIRHLAAAEVRQTDTALVGDPQRMTRLFARQVDGPTVRAEETRAEAEVEDGTTLVLDAGVYDFSAFSGAHRGAFPADVTFRGVGMDRTLLILHEIASTGEARNLGFEDLTLDTRGHYLADVRGDEPISLRFERARVIGFDQTPGGAVLLAARHGAVLARDSRFEAGFGNAPGAGSFFHVRGPFLVRFERCAIVGPFRSLYEKSAKASYAWVQCRFERLPEERRLDAETPDPNLRFENCLFEYLPAGEATPGARSRAELNPAWR